MTPPFALRTELRGLGLAERSIDIYVGEIRRAESWCQARGHGLATAPPDLIARYADTRARSSSTRKNMRTALDHYWTLTRRKNPPLRVILVPPKPEGVCKAVEEDEAKILGRHLRQRRDRQGLATAFGLWLGFRREEIARSRWSDFRRAGYVTLIGKGSKQRTIPVARAIAEMLARYPQPQVLPLSEREDESWDYIFPGRSGGYVHPNTIWQWVKDVCTEAGVPGVTPHVLRHTALATQNDVVGNLRAVRDFAGHSRTSTTEIYTRTKMQAMQAGVDALDEAY